MKLLSLLRSELHARLLKLRNLDRFCMTEAFQAAYNSSTEEERYIVCKYIDANEAYRVFRWTKLQLQKSRIIEELPVSELRALCADLGVKGYRYMTKDSLIASIKQREIKNEEERNVGKCTLVTA